MKKKYKDNWIKVLFVLVFVFGVGGTTYVIFSNEPNNVVEDVKNEKLDIIGIKDESIAQKEILDSLNTLKEAYDVAIFEKTALSKELENERKNIENLMEIIKASKDPSVEQIKIYRKQFADLKTSLSDKIVEVKKLKTQNKNLLSEIENQNVVMYKQKTENDTLVLKQKKLESSLKDASKLALGNFKVTAIHEKSSGKELETTKAKNAEKLKISFSVNGNSAAKTGRKVYYVQVLDQKNTVLGENKLIEFGNNKALVYSFLVSVDYQGKATNVYGVLNADGEKFNKGTYFVNFFDKQEIMGSSSITLE
jgi:hypothetical protein